MTIRKAAGCWLLVAGGTLLGVGSTLLGAAETAGARDQAVVRGLAWLRTQQQPDGRMSTAFPTALTALAVLAHAAAGVTPDDTVHGAALRRALRHVLTGQQPDGYLGRTDGSRMYGHGIATLCLTQVLGMTGDEDLEERLRDALLRAVAATVTAARVAKDANHAGGWHYEPDATSSDMSLTGWQLTSLQAARSIGMTVPDDVVQNAQRYVRRLTSADGNVGYNGPDQDRPALRGMACLALAGVDEPLVDILMRRMAENDAVWSGEWWFYRAWYDAAAMTRLAPRRWSDHGARLTATLLAHQDGDGSFPFPPGNNEAPNGPVYATAMALLTLCADRNLLPTQMR